jgi:hypothetical protein
MARSVATIATTPVKGFAGTLDFGVRARIEQAGTVAPGDPVELLD